jgi:hypothetical protein
LPRFYYDSIFALDKKNRIMEYAITFQTPGTDWINIFIETIQAWWNKMTGPKKENYFLIN